MNHGPLLPAWCNNNMLAPTASPFRNISTRVVTTDSDNKELETSILEELSSFTYCTTESRVYPSLEPVSTAFNIGNSTTHPPCINCNGCYVLNGRKWPYEYSNNTWKLSKGVEYPIIECSASTCQCTPSTCKLRVMQASSLELPVLKLVLNYTIVKGWCVHSDTMIEAGVFLFEYVGDLISSTVAKSRWSSHHSKNYVMSLREHYCRKDGETVVLVTHLDARKYGNVSRFVNHSCEPNTIIESVRIGASSVPHLAFFTLREIQPGEELTVDYASSINGDSNGVVRCKCNSNSCRGFLPFEE